MIPLTRQHYHTRVGFHRTACSARVRALLEGKWFVAESADQTPGTAKAGDGEGAAVQCQVGVH